MRSALAGVPELPGVLRLLRLEPRQGEWRRAQGRDDALQQQGLLVAPAGEAGGDPAPVPVQRVGLPGESGGIRELVEGVVRHAGQQRAEHRVPWGVVGDRGEHREVDVRARLPEFGVGVVPQIEAGPLHDARGPLLRCRRVDQRQLLGHEGIRRREREGVVRDRVAPARHGLRRDRAQPVRRVVERRDGIGGRALRHHRHECTLRDQRGEKPPFQRGVEVAEAVGRGQDLVRRIHVQGGGQRHRVGAGAGLVEKAEPDPRHARELVVVARLDASLADEGEAGEDRGDDVVDVREPRLGELDPDPEDREVRMLEARPRAQPLRPAACLQRREQAAAAFVAEEVRDERERPRRVVRAERRDLEREPEGADLAHRLDIEPCRQAPFRVERRGDAQAPRRRVAAPPRTAPGPSAPACRAARGRRPRASSDGPSSGSRRNRSARPGRRRRDGPRGSSRSRPKSARTDGGGRGPASMRPGSGAGRCAAARRTRSAPHGARDRRTRDRTGARRRIGRTGRARLRDVRRRRRRNSSYGQARSRHWRSRRARR